MKRLFLALLLLVFLPSMCFAKDKFVYIATDINGNEWYVDKTRITEDTKTGVISCYCWGVLSQHHRQQLISATMNATAQYRNLANRVVGIIAYMYIDRNKRVFRNVWIDFYDKNNNRFDRINDGTNWQPIAPTSVADTILLLIADNSIPIVKHNQAIEQPQRIPRAGEQYPSEHNTESSFTSDAVRLVVVFLLLGAFISAFLVAIITYHKPSNTPIYANTSSAGNTQQVHEQTTFTENKYKDDFDYPYEDIGKVTGL